MSVESNWVRILRWCEQHAPTTASRLLPPSGQQAVRAAEAATGQVWPAQLHEWFALHDGGFDSQPESIVLPNNEPISVALAVRTRAELLELFQDNTDDIGGTEALMTQAAGTEVETFLPAFIPIGSDGAGDYLAIDTRGGERSGCVIEFYKEGVAAFRCDSIEDMLDRAASALEQGTHCWGWVPVIEDGVLRWDFQP
jgi:cell wall assembly regulator SMI1